MSNVFFGARGVIGMTALSDRSKPLGQFTRYTNATIDSFYSEYGFAIPISEAVLPLDAVVQDIYPDLGLLINRYHHILRYLLIDHRGLVWRLLIQPDDKNELVVSHGIIEQGCGWWITDTEPGTQINTFNNMLLGFLYTDPTVAQIETFWSKYNESQGLQWLDVEAIVTKLNADYPKPTDSPKMKIAKRLLAQATHREKRGEPVIVGPELPGADDD